MRHLLLSTLILFGFCASLDAQHETRGLKAKLQSQAGKRWAICIGINNYDDPNIVKLKKAANDAWLLSDVLAAQGDFKVYTFTDVEKDGSLRAFTNNFFPTKIKIEQFLGNIGQYIKPDDLVMFSFSGHGINDAAQNGYLLPLDCRLSNPLNTALSEATITTWLKKLGVTRSLVLLDACRSELRNDRSIAGRDILYRPKFENAKVSAVFYSSEKGAASYEDPNSPNGAFTRFVANGLKGMGDKNNDDLVTLRELQTYVEDAMMNWALTTGHNQRPYIRLLDEQSGDLALAIAIPGIMKPLVESTKPFVSISTIAGIRMVSIPGGKFQMGSNYGEDDEKPVHNVTLTGFEMSATEITVGQFREFVNETGYRTEAEHGRGAEVFVNGKWEMRKDANWKNPYIKQGDDHPVVCVNFKDVKLFCEWLSSETNSKVRLPTEAEWEYACRAGTTTTYNTGKSESDLARAGWYFGNSGDRNLVAAKWDIETLKSANGRTHPVGQKAPNAWGLYDMHGNVWEMCSDLYGRYTNTNESNPTGPQSGSSRVFQDSYRLGDFTIYPPPEDVIRGGGWYNDAYYCRSTSRHDYLSEFYIDGHSQKRISRRAYIGFRVVRRP